MSTKAFHDKVLRLMKEHHDWFNKSIPLIASENIPSPAVREAIISDFGNRYAEGWPGDRIYAAFSNPGDYMMAASIPNGGHISHGKKEHSGTAGLVHGLNIEHYPFSKEEMTIDVDETKKKIDDMARNGRAPKIGMFGGSLFLFPHPVKELAEFMHDRGMYVNYDSAHVAGLIAGGEFQDPLKEGADSMTMSSHKTLWGPQGGCIVSYARHAEHIKKAIFP